MLYLVPGKVQEFQSGLRTAVGVHEVHAGVYESPVSPKASLGKPDDFHFLAAAHRDFPHPVSFRALRVGTRTGRRSIRRPRIHLAL